MNEKIKRQFADAISTATYHPSPDILWLEDDNQQPIGFIKEKLTERELLLLSVMFQSYQPLPLPKPGKEKQWADWLFNQGAQPSNPQSVRMIHFSLEKRIEDIASFRDVWESVLGSSMLLLWTTPTQGIIISDGATEDDDPDYISFSEAIATDFYVDLTILIGAMHDINHSLTTFAWERSCFKAVLYGKTSKRVYYEYEAVPYLLIQSLPSDQRLQFLTRMLDPDLSTDKELLKSLAVYFEHNLNISAASKALHMHRNSLQYRIDKLIERTHLDIRQFPQAVLMYITLFLLERR